MLIEIASLTDEPLSIEYQISSQGLGFHLDAADLIGEVDFRALIHLLEEGGILRCQGQCKALLDFQCSRCLEHFQENRDLHFNLIYAPNGSSGESKREMELKYEDMDLGFYDGIFFETNEIILEQLHLSIEMKALCREDCRGLCSICGRNNNLEKCDCHLEAFHPFQEQLLAIKKTLEKNH